MAGAEYFMINLDTSFIGLTTLRVASELSLTDYTSLLH